MIRLLALTTNDFKQLKDLQLRFPQKGSVLIEGRNEAGKSTLFEAIFFGLFGRPLLADTKIEDLVGYGATEALLELSLDVSGRRFDILRKVKLKGANVTKLKITGPEGEENVTGPSAVNRRIQDEIRLDPDAFLNSCFVEQKKLEKLEGMSARDREGSLMRLLNLDQMLDEERSLRVTIDDKRELDRLEQRWRLAGVMADIPPVQKRGREVKRLLDIIPIRENLAALDATRSIVQQAEARLAALDEPVKEMDARVARIGSLRTAGQTVATLQVRLETVEKHLQSVEALEKELSERDRLEREELPALDLRRRRLAVLRSQVSRLRGLEDSGEEVAVDAAGVRQRQKALQTGLRTIAEAGAGLSALEEPLAVLAGRLKQAASLRETLATLDLVAVRLDRITGYEADSERLRREWDELGRLESEGLPDLLKRKAGLAVLRSRCARLRHLEEEARRAEQDAGTARERLRLLGEARAEITEIERFIAAESESVADLEARERELGEREQSARLRQALEDWQAADEAGRSLGVLTRQVQEAEAGLENARATARSAEAREKAARAKVRSGTIRTGVSFGVGGALAVAAVVFGLSFLFVLAAIAAVAGVPMLLGMLAAGRSVSAAGERRAEAEAEVRTIENALLRLQGHYDSAKSSQGAAAGRLEMACLRLEGLGESIPATPEEATRRLAGLPTEEDGPADPEELARVREELAARRGGIEERKRVLATRQAELKDSAGPALRETADRLEQYAARIRESILAHWQETAVTRAGSLGLDASVVSESGLNALAQAAGEVDTHIRIARQRLDGRADLSHRVDESVKAIDAERREIENAWSPVAAILADVPPPAETAGLETARTRVEALLREADEAGTRQEIARLEEERHQHEGVRLSARRDLQRILTEMSARTETAGPAERLLAVSVPDTVGPEWAPLNEAMETLATRLEAWGARLQNHVECRWMPVVQSRARSLGVDLSDDLDTCRQATTRAEARTIEQIRSLKRMLDERAGLKEQAGRLEASVASERVQVAAARPALEAVVPDLPPLDVPADAVRLKERIEDEIVSLDETGSRARLQELRAEQEQARADRLAAEAETARLENDSRRRFPSLHVPEDTPMSPDALAAEIPDWEEADPARRDEYETEFNDLKEKDGYLKRTRHELSQALGIDYTVETLSPETEQAAYDEKKRDMRVRELAINILSLARGRIMSKVMPYTLEHMRRILPALTMDRYHDAELTDDYKIRVWDERASQWKSKNIFSGGTRDQFSLALRLAFAIATLPQERGSAPSFIFLDEPLSSFDAERSSALMYLLTHGEIAETFDQIFVISHSQAIAADDFPFRLRLESGRLAEPTSEDLKATSAQPGLELGAAE